MHLFQPFAVAICVFLCSLVTSSKAQLTHAELRSIKLKHAKECDKNGLSEENISKIFDLKDVSDDEKCLIACTMRKFELITEDGKFDIQGAIKLADEIQGESTSKDEKRMADVFVEECKATEGKNECDFGYNLYTCGNTVYTRLNKE